MLLNEMKSKYNIVPNERSFRSAIIACNQAEHEKRRRRNKILTLNREQFGKECHSMKEEALQPDDPLSLQWWEAALSLFRRMKEAGLIPSIHSSSSVIAACEAAGQWQRAIGILQSMTETCTNGDIDRPKPNLYCYNAALAACEKGNAWLEAIDIYERMKAEGGYVKPNFISLNSVSIALDKNEQKELAESIYTEALKANIVKPWKYTKETNSDKITRALVSGVSISCEW
jgi:pentatricopeptide repeat protein